MRKEWAGIKSRGWEGAPGGEEEDKKMAPSRQFSIWRWRFFPTKEKRGGGKKNQDRSDSDEWLFSLKPVANKNKITHLWNPVSPNYLLRKRPDCLYMHGFSEGGEIIHSFIYWFIWSRSGIQLVAPDIAEMPIFVFVIPGQNIERNNRTDNKSKKIT